MSSDAEEGKTDDIVMKEGSDNQDSDEGSSCTIIIGRTETSSGRLARHDNYDGRKKKCSLKNFTNSKVKDVIEHVVNQMRDENDGWKKWDAYSADNYRPLCRYNTGHFNLISSESPAFWLHQHTLDVLYLPVVRLPPSQREFDYQDESEKRLAELHGKHLKASMHAVKHAKETYDKLQAQQLLDKDKTEKLTKAQNDLQKWQTIVENNRDLWEEQQRLEKELHSRCALNTQVTLIIGTNGSGKSYLLKCMLERLFFHPIVPAQADTLIGESRHILITATGEHAAEQCFEDALQYFTVHPEQIHAFNAHWRMINQDDLSTRLFEFSIVPAEAVPLASETGYGRETHVTLQSSRRMEMVNVYAHAHSTATPLYPYGLAIAVSKRGNKSTAFFLFQFKSVVTLFVDEPESFLNPAMVSTFWRYLEEKLPTCKFIYATHEPAFFGSRPGCSRIVLQRVELEPDELNDSPRPSYIPTLGRLYTPNLFFWRVFDLNNLSMTLTAEETFALLGARASNIIFVEGMSASKDLALYHAIYGSKFTIIPLGSKSTIKSVCKNIGALKILFGHQWSEIYGLVDKDWGEPLEPPCFALDVHEIENLYCIPGCVEAICGKEAMDGILRALVDVFLETQYDLNVSQCKSIEQHVQELEVSSRKRTSKNLEDIDSDQRPVESDYRKESLKQLASLRDQAKKLKDSQWNSYAEINSHYQITITLPGIVTRIMQLSKGKMDNKVLPYLEVLQKAKPNFIDLVADKISRGDQDLLTSFQYHLQKFSAEARKEPLTIALHNFDLGSVIKLLAAEPHLANDLIRDPAPINIQREMILKDNPFEDRRESIKSKKPKPSPSDKHRKIENAGAPEAQSRAGVEFSTKIVDVPAARSPLIVAMRVSSYEIIQALLAFEAKIQSFGGENEWRSQFKALKSYESRDQSPNIQSCVRQMKIRSSHVGAYCTVMENNEMLFTTFIRTGLSVELLLYYLAAFKRYEWLHYLSADIIAAGPKIHQHLMITCAMGGEKFKEFFKVLWDDKILEIISKQQWKPHPDVFKLLDLGITSHEQMQKVARYVPELQQHL